MNRFFVIAILGVFTSACSNKVEENKIEENHAETKTAVTDSFKTKTIASEPEGIVGVIEVPEILTLAVKDSASMEEAPFKVGKAYSVIESDIKELKLEYKNEPPGALYYTNDPKKLVFECVIPINKMPATTPKHSTIVVLEATRAVVYNYYGPYDKLYTAYDKLEAYLKEHRLEQSGPAREFYLGDTEQEQDPNKWLSKIYIPVK